MNTLMRLSMIGLLVMISSGCQATSKGLADVGPGPVNPFKSPMEANQSILEREEGSSSTWVTEQAAKQANAAEAKTFTKVVNNSFYLN